MSWLEDTSYHMPNFYENQALAKALRNTYRRGYLDGKAGKHLNSYWDDIKDIYEAEVDNIIKPENIEKEQTHGDVKMNYTMWKKVNVCAWCYRPMTSSLYKAQVNKCMSFCDSCGAVDKYCDHGAVCFEKSFLNRILCFLGLWKSASYKIRVNDDLYVFDKGVIVDRYSMIENKK